MTTFELVQWRLQNQQLSQPIFTEAADVVRWLGAVQAQDYAGAKWAIGQRMATSNDALVEQAFTDGSLLRTHVLRPTWHFVTPADIRWLLTVTAPRVHALNAYYYRQVGLDDDCFAQCKAVLINSLQGGHQLTRAELKTALAQAGIATEMTLRVNYIMMWAELEGIICSGARRGKQFTYALLEERAPQATPMRYDEALAELTRRYFTSHGPATVKDLVWWSSLTMAEAKAGLELVKAELGSEVIGDQTFWFAPSTVEAKQTEPRAYLLPNYDEFISYADRSAIISAEHAALMARRENTAFSHLLVYQGHIIGTWQRTVTKNKVSLTYQPFGPLAPSIQQAVVAAAQRYGTFLDCPVILPPLATPTGMEHA